MNRTIISIEVQDNGDKEAAIIVKGERNNQILFEEQFSYSDNEKHPLRLHLLKERFINKDFAEGKSLSIMSIRKLFKDITERSKSVGVPDYRETDLSQPCISAKQIRDMVLKNGWNEKQLIDWAKKELNPDISEETLEVLIDQVFHHQSWWDYCH